MKPLLLFSAVAVLTASCANLSRPGDLRAAPGEGAAPVRLQIGREMAVPSPSGLGQRQPAVAYGDGVYLLVWREGFNGFQGESDILAMRIGADGRPLDRAPIPVCTSPGVQESPAVAFCAGQFLVAWAPRAGKTGLAGLYALRTRRVAPDGALGPLTHSLFGPNLMTWPALASNEKDEFLLLWQEFVGDHFAVRGTRISATTDDWLDTPRLNVMVRAEGADLSWARGERLGVARTGNGYVVCQSAYATFLGTKGETLLPLTRTWDYPATGGHTAVAAWGKGFVLLNVKPNPDPWGWGGTGAILGMTVTRESGRAEREALLTAVPPGDKAREWGLIADGGVANCLDAARWLNHPGWPMGMPGGFKHSMGDVWPSGPPAAAFNGHSLVVVWPRGHVADNRRLTNRDLYLMRLLPGWAKVDANPVPFAIGGGEETNPVLCAGSSGQMLLAYERMTETGVEIRYRLLDEASDKMPPTVVRVGPKSPTEMIVTFDEPLDEAGTNDPRNFRIDGLTVSGAALCPDGRSGSRDVILTTTPPQVGRRYTLQVTGISDRSPARNAVKDQTFDFLAKPGFIQQSAVIYNWDNPRGTEGHYPNPDRIGTRDYICSWSLLAPVPLDRARHPFDPPTVGPSPGDLVASGTNTLRWTVAEGEVLDLEARLGAKAKRMVYAATYVFSEHERAGVLRLDSSSHNRAWWNGRLVNDGISPAQSARGFHDYTDEIPIRLRAGWNRLLLQVETGTGTWMMVGQITDDVGRPIRDLTWQRARPGLRAEIGQRQAPTGTEMMGSARR